MGEPKRLHYLSEKVNYGGQVCTRGYMINDLHKIMPERCVQMYLIGHASFERRKRQMNYKLNSRPFALLCEALRRHTRFNLRDLKKPLSEAWTGLGTYTDYKPAIVADLMTYVHRPNPRCIQWWRLTDRGAAIVQQ